MHDSWGTINSREEAETYPVFHFLYFTDKEYAKGHGVKFLLYGRFSI